jgi:hypothetical protein
MLLPKRVSFGSKAACSKWRLPPKPTGEIDYRVSRLREFAFSGTAIASS